MTRVLHTGDTHVGYRQYHEPARRRDFLRALETVVEDAVAEDVDAVVHAGDLFHDRRPDLRDLQGVVNALRDLREAGIPFLAIVGNHEATRSGQWLDLFADLDLAERLGAEPRVVGDLALYGLDHVPASKREDLDYEFADHDADAAALVAHGLFEPFDPGEWDTDRLLAESTVDFDALLLGDNHDPGVKQVDDTWVTYPGSTERASAAEREDRGYNLVSLEDDGLRIARRTIDTREFVFVDVELEPGEGGDVVRDRVREYDHEDAVTVVTIEGDGEPVTPAPIEELALDRGALVARVNDRRDVEVEDDELDVSFADPDEAVRQRVRELGLSEAALDLDRVVRDDEVADANVRERARRRVDEHLDDGLDAFEPAPEPEEADAEPESGDESEESESGGVTEEPAPDGETEEPESDGESGESAADTGDQGSQTETREPESDGESGEASEDADAAADSDDAAAEPAAATATASSAASGDGSEAPDAGDEQDAGDERDGPTTDDASEEADERADQASMEEYL